MLHQLLNGSDLPTEGQRTGAAKEQAFVGFTSHCMTQLLVNAELAHGRVAIAQAAVAQAVKRHIALFLFVGMRLQL
jgi:hypothetical protein